MEDPVNESSESSRATTLPGLSRWLLLVVLLSVAWLLWSGLYKPLLLGLGVLSCLLVMLALRRMGYFSDETFAFRFTIGLVSLWVWLLGEIWRSSIEVTRVVLAREVAPSPTVLRLDVSEFDPVDQAIIGNSITLTPGTLTLDVFDNQITVHALTGEGALELSKGELIDRCRRMRAS